VWLNLVNGSVGYCPPEPLYNVENYQVFTYLVTGTSSVLDVLHGEAFAE
jgi:hypothetical protein